MGDFVLEVGKFLGAQDLPRIREGDENGGETGLPFVVIVGRSERTDL